MSITAQNVFGTAPIVAFRTGSLLDCRTTALLIIGNSYSGMGGGEQLAIGSLFAFVRFASELKGTGVVSEKRVFLGQSVLAETTPDPVHGGSI